MTAYAYQQPSSSSSAHHQSSSSRASSLSLSRSYVIYPRRLTLLILSVCVSFGLLYYLHVTGNAPSLAALYYRPKYQWRPEFSSLNGPDVSWSDPSVVKKLVRSHMERPPPSSSPNQPSYNLSEPWETDPSMGQSQLIRKIFSEKLESGGTGFFVECGALDGETRSNTLFLERFKGWTGLLIEADPTNYQLLKGKNRRSFTSNTCLSTKSYPVMVSFEQNSNQGRISDSYGVGFIEKNHVDVQCFPFGTYMLALNRTRVDYFSLDVEGAELDILKTIDFNKYDVSTLSVEFIHDVEGKAAIKEYMTAYGYFVLTEVTHPNWLANDFILVKKSFYDKLSSGVRDALDAVRREYNGESSIMI